MRIYRLDFQPLWWDEGISLYLASQDVTTVLSNRARDVHPPLYFLLLRSWTDLASAAPSAARYFSLLPGILSVVALYTLARRLTSRSTALLAALILALSPFQIHHAQEARMYPLVTLLALVSTYLLLRVVDDSVRSSRGDVSNLSRGLWIAYTITVVCALLIHYYAVFIPLFHGVYVLLRHRAALLKWIAAMLAGVLLYTPWLAMIAGELPGRAAGKIAAEADPAQSPAAFVGRYLSTITVGYNISGLALVWVAGLVAALIALGLFELRRRGELPLLFLTVPVTAGLVLNQILPFDAFPRLLAYAAPAAYLLIAAGLLRLCRWSSVGGAMASLAIIGLVIPYQSLYTQPRHTGEDYRPIIATLDELAMPRDLVILDFPWQAGYLHSYSRSHVAWWLAAGSDWSTDPSQMSRDLDQLRQDHLRLWYVAEQGLGSRRGQNIEGDLIDHAYLALDQWYGSNRLLLFGTESAGPLRPVDARFEQHIVLTAIAIPDSAGAGAVLPVRLAWHATESVDTNLKTFVHVLNAAGQIVAQHDTQPVAGLRPMNTWPVGEHITDRLGVLIPKDLPAGRYRVELGLYDPATGRRLPVSKASSPVGDRLLSDPVMIRH